MIIDNFTLIFSLTVIILGVATSLLASPFNRRLTAKKGKERLTTAEMPRVSVIVVSNGDAEQMDNHLSAILTQVYEPGFEVIVVATQHDSMTEDVLKRYSSVKNLYTTFAPNDSLFMSKVKLAITIGVKAAHNEWILLTDSRLIPHTDNWIAAMASNCHDTTSIIMGYSRYDTGTRHFYQFKHTLESAYSFHRACVSNAVTTRCANIMFHKHAFIESDGFRGNLEFAQGEYDFIVNKFSAKGSTAVETSPDAWLVQDTPSRATWRREQVCLISYRRKLAGINSFRLCHIADTVLLHANYALAIGAAAYATACSNWILAAAASISLITTITIRTIVAAKKTSLLGCNVPAWKLPVYELRCTWSNAISQAVYWKTDKREFSTHKL